MPDNKKKPEVTDLVPDADPKKETNTAKAASNGKLADIKPSKTSLAKFSNFTNGKLRNA